MLFQVTAWEAAFREGSLQPALMLPGKLSVEPVRKHGLLGVEPVTSVGAPRALEVELIDDPGVGLAYDLAVLFEHVM